jgi:hypothetical protein
VLINRERVGEGMGSLRVLGSMLGLGGGGGFTFEGSEGAYRDVLVQGDTDDGVRRLCQLLGWTDELDALIAAAAGGSSGSNRSGGSAESGDKTPAAGPPGDEGTAEECA